MRSHVTDEIDKIPITAPSGGVVMDVPLVIGTMFLIPMVSATEGELVTCKKTGRFTLPKATGFAPGVGADAYYDATEGELTSDTTKHHIGKYAEAALSAATSAVVDVTGVQGSDAELQAVQTGLTDHTGDISGAHAASAISVADAGGKFTATDVEAALAELEARVAALET